MIYTGEFNDIAEKLYQVEITTEAGSANSNIVLADDPVVISVDGGDGNIYKPVRYSNAVIRMFTTDYNFDLYSSTAQQNKVVISSEGLTEWTGYLTSNLYNVGYENEEEVIELEAIDALSTLQYYKYTPVHDKKGVVSLLEILSSLIKRCNAYSFFVMSDCTQLASLSDECLASKLCISEENFFDEDGEGMTMQEVLEEICQYLGLCCTAYRDTVYFLDLDALKNGIDSYYKFEVGNSTPTKVTLSHSAEITADDYAENGGQLSLDNVYNKVTVKDSLYSFDSVIPSIWEDDYLKNTQGQGHIQVVDELFKKDKFKCFFKYYTHKNYKSYYYSKSSMAPVTVPSTIDYNFTQNYVGATICRHSAEKVNDYNEKFNDIGFQDYLLLHCHDSLPWQSTVRRKMFELEVNDSKVSFLGSHTYLIIKGSFRYMDREGVMYVMDGYTNKDDDFNPIDLFIWARLQYGDKYWDGDRWINTPTDFKLYYDSHGQTDHCINQVFQIKNNISYDMGLDGEEGYSIPMPSTTEVVVGKPTFTLYQPHKLAKAYRCDAVWLSNFDIIAKVQNKNTDVDQDSDTEYSNVIDEDYVNEFEDIEFNICTWDDKEPNYSAVAYNNKGAYTYLDTVYNKATQQTIRAEEQYIYRLVTQYSTPSVILELNLKNQYLPYSVITDSHMWGKKFIVDSQEINLRDAKVAIKLMEKK